MTVSGGATLLLLIIALQSGRSLRFRDAYMGCYKDDRWRPVLDGLGMSLSSPDGMTNQQCVQLCRFERTSAAGTSSGSKCFCGEVSQLARLGAAPASDCSMRCDGDRDQACGSLNRLTVFRTGIVEVVSPTKEADAMKPTTTTTASNAQEGDGRNSEGECSFGDTFQLVGSYPAIDGPDTTVYVGFFLFHCEAKCQQSCVDNKGLDGDKCLGFSIRHRWYGKCKCYHSRYWFSPDDLNTSNRGLTKNRICS